MYTFPAKHNLEDPYNCIVTANTKIVSHFVRLCETLRALCGKKSFNRKVPKVLRKGRKRVKINNMTALMQVLPYL